MKWREFHDRRRPKWFEPTGGFTKLYPSGPEFPIVYSGKLTADGSTSDFEAISVSVKIISAMYCAR